MEVDEYICWKGCDDSWKEGNVKDLLKGIDPSKKDVIKKDG